MRSVLGLMAVMTVIFLAAPVGAQSITGVQAEFETAAYQVQDVQSGEFFLAGRVRLAVKVKLTEAQDQRLDRILKKEGPTAFATAYKELMIKVRAGKKVRGDLMMHVRVKSDPEDVRKPFSTVGALGSSTPDMHCTIKEGQYVGMLVSAEVDQQGRLVFEDIQIDLSESAYMDINCKMQTTEMLGVALRLGQSAHSSQLVFRAAVGENDLYTAMGDFRIWDNGTKQAPAFWTIVSPWKE